MLTFDGVVLFSQEEKCCQVPYQCWGRRTHPSQEWLHSIWYGFSHRYCTLFKTTLRQLVLKGCFVGFDVLLLTISLFYIFCFLTTQRTLTQNFFDCLLPKPCRSNRSTSRVTTGRLNKTERPAPSRPPLLQSRQCLNLGRQLYLVAICLTSESVCHESRA